MSLILIVDDKAAMRETVARYLSEGGHRILQASSGEEALGALRTERVDALITDLRMPGMDGLQLLAKAREADAGLPVLLMTAHGGVEEAVQAMRLGAADFLVKPFPMEELEIKLQRCLQVSSLNGSHQALKERLELAQGRMVGVSPPMLELYESIRKAAAGKTTVLLSGESGTGKELAAQAIHEASPRREGPFVKVHGAALSPGLLESELFGHEKGAFTGADRRKPGRFELAHGGTLFLDEISEVPLEIQVKLLRVLQEREFERVGGTQTLRVDVRLIAASNRDLGQQVAKGRFREDLYYRIHVVNLRLPPLRERPSDIPLLAAHFLERFARELGKPARRLGAASLKAFQAYPWPGNVREMQNLLERAMVFSEGEEVEAIPGQTAAAPALVLRGGLDETLEGLESALIRQCLQECGGVQNQAAKKLGVSRSALQYKIHKFKLEEFCRANQVEED